MIKILLLLLPFSIYANISIDYVNQLRGNSGLNYLSHSNLLDNSSMNHLLYLKNKNIFSHNEHDKNNKFYTGKSATKRINFLSHNGFALENMSKGESGKKIAVENLFSAIYHRFSFLSFNIDEIGMAEARTKNNKENIYVFNMANSIANRVCKKPNFQGFGRYYRGVCINKNQKVGSNAFLDARDYLFKKNPNYITYPYNYQQNIQPYFLEEIPDPLPNCSISGYPVSVQFNPLKFKKIKLISFQIFKVTDSAFIELENKKILTSKNDIKFKKHQFALMPLDMLDWGSRYLVVFKYFQLGENKEIRFHFNTKKLPYPSYIIKSPNKIIKIRPNQKSYIFIKPQNCNSRLKHTKITYDKSSYRIKSKIESKFVNVISLYINKTRNKSKNIKIENNLYDFEIKVQ